MGQAAASCIFHCSIEPYSVSIQLLLMRDCCCLACGDVREEYLNVLADVFACIVRMELSGVSAVVTVYICECLSVYLRYFRPCVYGALNGVTTEAVDEGDYVSMATC